MEERVGLPLVRRNEAYIDLTHGGEFVLKWAQKLLYESEGMQQELGSLKNNLCEKKILGVVPKAMPLAAKVYSVIRKHTLNF